MALDTKLRDEFIELSHEDHGIEFIALQPVAIVDHVCSVDEATLKFIIASDDIGGSRRVHMDEIQRILGKGPPWHDLAHRDLTLQRLVQLYCSALQLRSVSIQPRLEGQLQTR